MEKPVMLAKDWDTSGEQGCPSVWLEDGEFVCLGPEVSSQTLNSLDHVQPGERAVRLRPEVVRAALARYDAARSGGQ
jgi:hypothetical protein